LKNSKIVKLLGTLSEDEVGDFIKFIESNFFNTNQKVANFGKYLLQFHPNINEANISKAQIIKVLSKSTKGDHKLLSYWASDLVKLLEKFVIYQYQNTQAQTGQIALMERYAEANLDVYYKQAKQKFDEFQLNQAEHNEMYYFNLMKAAEIDNMLFLKKRKRDNNESLQQAINNLDWFYLALKLKYACETANRQMVLSGSYSLKLINDIIKFIENYEGKLPAQILIYYNIYNSLIKPTEEGYFNELKLLLAENSKLFAVKDSRNMYLYAINYCVSKINSGSTDYVDELLTIYKQSLQQNILLEDEMISPWSYQNIVGAAIRANEFDWAKEFIYKYKKHLHPKFKNNAFHYNLASYHFSVSNLSKAQDYLLKVDYNDTNYVIGTRVLLMKIYFENKEYEALESLLNAFRNYLHRNSKMSARMRKLYLNTIKYVKKLNNVHVRDFKKLHHIKKQIETTDNLADRKWMLSKIDSYLKFEV